MMRLSFLANPHRIRTILIIIAVLIAVFSLITEYVVEVIYFGQADLILLDFLDLFSVNLEESIPTWYSVLILFVASALLAVIAHGKSRAKDIYASYWWGLSAIFLYFSLDEGAAIHEIMASPLAEAFDTSGFLTFGWQIVAIPLVIIFGLVYLRFLFHLPSPTRNWFIVGAILYAGGALIFEGFSASQYGLNGITMTYLGLATIEEFCEILGVSLFIFALLDYMQSLAYSVTITSNVDDIVNDVKPQITSTSEQPSSIPEKRFFNPTIGLIALLVVTNILLLGWILGNRPRELPLDIPTFYTEHLATLEAENILVIETPDVFGISQNHSFEVVRTLIEQYAEIYVVAFPSDDTSVIFAGDTLPFDRDILTEWLHANGQVEFIIFDSSAVALIASQ